MRASCEGVFCGIVALAGLFSVLLRATIGLSRAFPGAHGPSVLGFFFLCFRSRFFEGCESKWHERCANQYWNDDSFEQSQSSRALSSRKVSHALCHRWCICTAIHGNQDEFTPVTLGIASSNFCIKHFTTTVEWHVGNLTCDSFHVTSTYLRLFGVK